MHVSCLSGVDHNNASGKDPTRPTRDEMIAFVRAGDTVIVHSMDRLARNLDDRRRLVRILTGKGVRVEFVEENLTFTDGDSPVANLLLSVMGASLSSNARSFSTSTWRDRRGEDPRRVHGGAELGFTDLRRFGELPRGGHLAAPEQPESLVGQSAGSSAHHGETDCATRYPKRR